MSKKDNNVAKDAVIPVAAKFSRDQLLRSDRYKMRRDLLGALLTDGEKYSLYEVDAKIDNYMKGKVI